MVSNEKPISHPGIPPTHIKLEDMTRMLVRPWNPDEDEVLNNHTTLKQQKVAIYTVYQIDMSQIYPTGHEKAGHYSLQIN